MRHAMKHKQRKYLFYGLLILAAALLQNTAGLFPVLQGARCLLLLPVTILLALSEEEKTAALIGLFSGLIWDIHAPMHMGFNAIYLMLICFFAAAVCTHIARDIFITNMLAAFLGVFLYCALYWLLFIVLPGRGGAADTILTFYLPSAVYTACLAPVFWLCIKPLKKKFAAD